MNARKKIAIIGAGASGLFAARSLQKLGIQPALFEKESRIGGKCNTYTDPAIPTLKTEWGAALIAPNYGVVIDAVIEKKIEFEHSFPTRRSSVEIIKKFDDLSWFKKITFSASFVKQLAKFSYAVSQYHFARNHLNSLPTDFELPFAQYAKKHHLEDLNLMLKPLVTGFGYGAMEDVPAYSVMEYMGLGTIPSLSAECIRSNASLVGIKGGMQYLMEKVGEDFDIITSANIKFVERRKEGVKIRYEVNGHSQIAEYDSLILATSPLQWPKLGMKLTSVEQECVNALTYYRYPIAVCKIPGLLPEHVYIPKALERESFGHLALITTRDNRPLPQEGRLCTAYINLLPGANTFSFDEKSVEREILKNDLVKVIQQDSAPAEYKNKNQCNVNIIDTKIWEDYMPTLPWQQRLKLEREQMNPDTQTLYVGAYTVGGFEDVRCVTNQATHAVNKYLNNNSSENFVKSIRNEISRVYNFFFAIPRVSAVTQQHEKTRPKIT